MSKTLEVSDGELLFLDTQLQAVLEGLFAARERTIEDRSLTADQLLAVDATSLQDIDTATELLRRIQQEIHERGIGR